jgi:hypothetical protein
LRSGNCGSVHIGGGEPFLDFEGLLVLIRELRREGIRLDYIETNAFWAADDDAADRINALASEGVPALCISLDPYHAEYVPYGLPLKLAQKCRNAGLGFFLWKEEFLPVLSKLAPERSHSRAEMEQGLSRDYIAETASAYGIQPGGRAVNIEEEYLPARPAETLLDDVPCRGLLSTGHFHVDGEGFFIPPGCTGLRIPLAEIVGGIPEKKYPLFEALYTGGIRSLWQFAAARGFTDQNKGYPSKCGLCFHLRRYLVPEGFSELDPEHYRESLGYYR